MIPLAFCSLDFSSTKNTDGMEEQGTFEVQILLMFHNARICGDILALIDWDSQYPISRQKTVSNLVHLGI